MSEELSCRNPEDEGALAAAPASRRLRVVSVRSFEAAHAVRSASRDEFLRRFATLLIDEESARFGGAGCVMRATNPRGESFAVKVLGGRSAAYASLSSEVDSEPPAWAQAAFEEEYAAHQSLSGIKGFPRLYGRAEIDGRPALIMEWIEGVTLAAALPSLAVDGHSRLSPLTAARLGRDLFDLLTRMALVAGGFAHRDVSLANVMIDTAQLSVAQQVEEGSFELRLIDFGSAATEEEQDRSLTAVYGAPRGATADFAAPEMLTRDVAAVAAHRHAPAVDVYAAAGVLYRLLCGRAPFDLSQADDQGEPLSPYRCKTETEPAPFAGAHGACAAFGALGPVLAREPETAVIVSRHLGALAGDPPEREVAAALDSVDSTLGPLLETCLSAEPRQRPKAEAVREALAAFCASYDENVGRSLRGQAVSSCLEYLPVGPFGLTPRRFAAGARRVIGVTALVAWAAVVVSSAVLLGGTEVAVTAGPFDWAGPVSPVVVALLVALPGALGLLARGRRRQSGDDVLRGSLGLVCGMVLVLVALVFTQASVGSLQLFAMAEAAASLCAWLPMVSDYVFGEEGVRRWARKALPPAVSALPASLEEVCS